MKIGQEVVCIRESYFNTPDVHPVKGEIYTIQGFDPFGGLWFVEIVNEVKYQEHNGQTQEVAFNETRFVPIEYNQSAIDELLEQSLARH